MSGQVRVTARRHPHSAVTPSRHSIVEGDGGSRDVAAFFGGREQYSIPFLANGMELMQSLSAGLPDSR